ncbi:MAG: ABC transporter permease [Eubacteriales bacterium]|jgi:spermidine/putrescine transport system permease protein|nr:ABC transporter permease [Eubacteriales bacterium]
MKKTGKLSSTYLLAFFALLYLPVLSVILYSFNKSPSTAQWTGWTFDWYRELLGDPVIADNLKNSLTVALLTALLSAVIGTFAAIISMNLTKNMKKTLQSVMLIPLLVPEVALGISLLIFFNALGLPFGILTLVLSHSLFCVPYIYIMVRLRLVEIDKAVLEAARDLGAGTRQVIGTIILPLVTPSIVTASLLAIAMSLDDVVLSMYMSGPSTTTLPVHIFSRMRIGVTPKINALCTLILLGTFIIVGLSQFISRGPKKKEKIKNEDF